MRTSLVFIIIVTALGACSPGQGGGTSGMTNAAEGDLTAEEKGRIVARVAGRDITLADFEHRLEQQSAFARSRYNSLQRKKEFLSSLVRFELLALEAEARGLGAHPDVEMARKQAMVRALSKKILAERVALTDISEDEVRAYYDANTARFERPATVHAAHILVADRAEAVALLGTYHATLGEAPEAAQDAFAQLARTSSQDLRTKDEGGDLGRFSAPGDTRNLRDARRAPVPPSVARAAFDLTADGEVTPGPVRSAAGWHLVQRIDRRARRTQTFEEVSASIQTRLFRARRTQTMTRYVAELKRSAKVEINAAALAKIKVAPPVGPGPNIAPPLLRPVKETP